MRLIMATQLPLPTGPRATSAEARRRIAPCASKLHSMILAALGVRGATGATDHELAAFVHGIIGAKPETVRARRIELTRAAQVRDSGRTRKTPSGRAAVVWIRA